MWSSLTYFNSLLLIGFLIIYEYLNLPSVNYLFDSIYFFG